MKLRLKFIRNLAPYCGESPTKATRSYSRFKEGFTDSIEQSTRE